jgi:hypothetical protein
LEITRGLVQEQEQEQEQEQASEGVNSFV